MLDNDRITTAFHTFDSVNTERCLLPDGWTARAATAADVTNNADLTAYFVLAFSNATLSTSRRSFGDPRVILEVSRAPWVAFKRYSGEICLTVGKTAYFHNDDAADGQATVGLGVEDDSEGAQDDKFRADFSLKW